MRWIAVALAALLLGPAVAAHAAWPGTNGIVVYDCGPVDHTGGKNPPPDDLCAITPGGTPRHLTTTKHVSEEEPSFSPDGRLIALQRRSGAQYDIWTLNADGSGARPIVTAAGDDVVPVWSPDGRSIVYSHDDPSTHKERLMLVNADGTGARPLSPAGDANFAPAWRPDGSEILYTQCAKAGCDILGVRPDGTGRHVVIGGKGDQRQPNISADGTHVVFAEGPQVVVANADGTGRRTLTKGTSVFRFGPTFSPDGATIVYTQCHDGTKRDPVGNCGVFTIRASGGSEHVLIDGRGFEARPDWQALPAAP